MQARALTAAVSAWETSGRQAEHLLRGYGLEQAEEWAKGRIDITPKEREFLRASHDAIYIEQIAEAKIARLRQRQRLLLSILGLLVVGMMATSIAVWFGYKAYLTERYEAYLAERLLAQVMAEQATSLARIEALKVENNELALRAHDMERRARDMEGKAHAEQLVAQGTVERAALHPRLKALTVKNDKLERRARDMERRARDMEGKAHAMERVVKQQEKKMKNLSKLIAGQSRQFADYVIANDIDLGQAFLTARETIMPTRPRAEEDVGSPIEGGAARAGLARSPLHHVLPQEHRKWFEERGFTGDNSIDKYCIQLDRSTHEDIHGGGNHKLARQEWPGEWNQMIMRTLLDREKDLGRKLTVDEILQEVRSAMVDYDVDRPFVDYRRHR